MSNTIIFNPEFNINLLIPSEYFFFDAEGNELNERFQFVGKQKRV
ncbi:MAG: hypothetical protein PUC73_08785 [Lachnospiraceae bacterium]|nr:hypothetical protein [Lachnospiraceae bacterium]